MTSPRFAAGIRTASSGRLLLVAVVLSSCGTHGKSNEPEAAATKARPGDGNPEISTTVVAEHEVRRVIACSARIAFDESKVAHIWSPVTGRVTRIAANLGDRVRAGQVLAAISSPDLGSALSDVEKARPMVLQLEKSLKRQQELYAAHAGAQRDMEAAQATYDQAVTELQRSESRAKLLLTQKGLTGSSGQAFELTSPIEGEVVARQINPGAEVQGQYNGGTGGELFTVGSINTVWAFAEVYEQDLAAVKLGGSVDFKLVAFPDRVFTGSVDWISGTIDPTSRTVRVRCVLKNADNLLKPEMYATANIATGGRTAVAIPRSSLLHLGKGTEVIAVNKAGHRYERRSVGVDENESGDWLPVRRGLEVGDSVVTKGALLLSTDN